MSQVTGWLLAGGEGRRMQGQDKGLVDFNGRPLAHWVLSSLRPQCQAVRISANRNQDRYEAMLGAGPGTVWPDDPDLPAFSGPLAGIITAMRHTETDWLMLAPCDMPLLPGYLVPRLLAQARQTNAEIVIPCTDSGTPDERHHWVCGLIHKRVCPDTVSQFVNGERQVGRWVQSHRWSSAPFDDTKAFANMNTLETLRGRA